MPNSPNPFLLLTTEHLNLIFNGIYYYIELKKNTEKKNKVVSKYDIRANSGPFFQSTRLSPHSQ